MRIQNISNAQVGPKLTFKSVYRVENGYAPVIPCADIDNAHDNYPTQRLFENLSEDKKRTVALITAPGLGIYEPDLVLLDGKDDRDASAYKSFEAELSRPRKKIKKAARKSSGKIIDIDYYQALRNASIHVTQKNDMYKTYCKKAIVITMDQFTEILEKGFDAVVSKLKR